MEIRLDDPRRGPVTRLLREHLDDMALHSPPGSVHALDVDALCAPSITFWTATDVGELLGCGALSQIDARHGEIKSMRTATAFRRMGVAAALLRHIVAEAQRRSYARVSLETGSMDAFAPARTLYSRFGFVCGGPFADYVLDPNSVFMFRDLG